MSNIRTSKKLLSALAYLSDERRGDCTEQAWLEAIDKHKVTHADVYRAMRAYGLRWSLYTQSWMMPIKNYLFVEKMFVVVRKIDDRLIKAQG